MMQVLSHLSNIIFLSFVIGIPIYATCKKVNAFDNFIIGAKEGFTLCISLVPYLVGIMVAIGMLRASGFFELLHYTIGPFLSKVGVPEDLLPLALIRPFSGSAANGIMAEIIHNHGGDSFVSKAAATMMGSTETTFYVVAVYFGAVNIRRTRYAIPTGLLADLTGVIAAIIVCHYLFV